jgi:hypothetical protein
MPAASVAASVTRLLGLLAFQQSPTQSLSTYVVRFSNMTSTTFDEVVVFYKRKSLSGVVFLNKIGLIPGEVTEFNLGFCYLMESYVIGLFINSELVAQLPAAGDGNMTPERASQFDPSDIDPCVDSWSIWES